MRQLFLTAVAAAMIAGAGIGQAGDLSVGVNLSGQVAPGVYGEVQLGNSSPPPLVYAQPVQIVRVRHAEPPIYLNVPPTHARNWRTHCHEYNACNRPVYFVRSAEYEPGYRRHDRRYDHDNHHSDDHDHGHQHDGDRSDDHHGDH
jgi:hypothetical protein